VRCEDRRTDLFLAFTEGTAAGREAIRPETLHVTPGSTPASTFVVAPGRTARSTPGPVVKGLARFETHPPQEITLRKGSDNNALFLPNPASEAVRMTRHQHWTVQAPGADGGQRVWTFGLAGLQEVLVPLREACGW
jgi:hypothetical protein